MTKPLSMQSMPNEERPRERLFKLGAEALSSAELLAILLGTGTKKENVLHLAERIFSFRGGLNGLSQVTVGELEQIHGLGKAKIAQIIATIELAKRLSLVTEETSHRIQHADDAVRLLHDMGNLTQETVRVILLNTNREVLAIPTIYKGTVNASVVRTAEIYREAIIRNCPAIILAHNHPSGDPSPSPEDIELTRMLASAGQLLDIQLIDHLIIAKNDWVSLRELGFAF